MKKGQNGSSWSSERSLMYGGNVQNALTPPTPSLASSQRTSIDGVSFSEGDLLLQVTHMLVVVCSREKSESGLLLHIEGIGLVYNDAYINTFRR